MNNKLKVKVMIHPHGKDIPLPSYMSDLASGMDLSAAIYDDVVIEPSAIALIPTGISVALPSGFEFQVRPRSGIAIKRGLTVINAPGTIDADYRGEIKVGLINLGKEPVRVQRGDRIAQMILSRVFQVKWETSTSLAVTSRGEGGFGHTGMNSSKAEKGKTG